MKQKFVFGWVDANIHDNFEAYTQWKEYGTNKDAQLFFNDTADDARARRLEWFQVPYTPVVIKPKRSLSKSFKVAFWGTAPYVLTVSLVQFIPRQHTPINMVLDMLSTLVLFTAIAFTASHYLCRLFGGKPPAWMGVSAGACFFVFFTILFYLTKYGQ